MTYLAWDNAHIYYHDEQINERNMNSICLKPGLIYRSGRRAAESMDFRVLRLRLRFWLEKSTPSPTPTPDGSIKIHIMVLKFIMEMCLNILPETIPCAFQGFALQICIKIACGIKKQVLGNPPSSASFAENVRPNKQNGPFSTKST